MSYYLAPSLVKLRDQIDAAWPNRSKASDGWIGDTSHQARKSDHNPDYSANGVVRAIDVTAKGINVNALLKAAKKDLRTEYIIHKGKIYGASHFKARKYTGSNPHTHHVHISIKHVASAASNTSNWLLKSTAKPNTKPKGYSAATKKYQDAQRYYPGMVRDGINGPMNKAHKKWVKRLQNALNQWHAVTPKLKKDGWYGPAVVRATRQVMTANHGYAYKGIIEKPIPQPGRILCAMLGIPTHPSA